MGAGSILETTVEQYLDYSDTAECPVEFHDGEVFRMDDASGNHAILAVNIGSALKSRLGGTKCLAMASARFRLSEQHYVVPDIAVVCKPYAYTDNRRSLSNPTLVVEILSPSTKDYDLGGKFELYRGVDSLNEYILIAQDRVSITVFRRAPENEWILSSYNDLTKILPVRSLGFEIPLAEIYDGVEFPTPA